MTEQHWAKATQWADHILRAANHSDSSCILELLGRVKELEGRYETCRQATLAWGKDVDKHGRYIDNNLKRIEALESYSPLVQPPAMTATQRTHTSPKDKYYGQYARTMDLLVRLQSAVCDCPEPDGDASINWGHVVILGALNRRLAEALTFIECKDA